jgi:hypothetical protein
MGGREREGMFSGPLPYHVQIGVAWHGLQYMDDQRGGA